MKKKSSLKINKLKQPSGCISPKQTMSPLELLVEYLEEKSGKKKLPDIKDKIIY